MTTKVTIEPAGHHVLVTIVDRYKNNTSLETKVLQPGWKYVEGQHVKTGQGPLELYATTTRQITVVDLEPNDLRIDAVNAENNRPDP